MIKGILFNTDMVRAMLDGRKTVTRRVIKPRYRKDEGGFQVCTVMATGERWIEKTDWDEDSFDDARYVRPPYMPGDILYVRETWGISNLDYENRIAYIVYKASENEKDEGCKAVRLPDDKFEKLYDSMAGNYPDWKPSIHMPKEAARIWLKVTDVRVERLQDITNEQAQAEGSVRCYEEIRPDEDSPVIYQSEDGRGYYTLGFKHIWNSTIKKSDRDHHGWDANPWVWVIGFERCEKPESEG